MGAGTVGHLIICTRRIQRGVIGGSLQYHDEALWTPESELGARAGKARKRDVAHGRARFIHRIRESTALVVVGLLLAAGACNPADRRVPEAAANSTDGSVPLYDDLGDHHVPIGTDVADAQSYFDQGMRLSYAFNHAEAIRSFEEATRLDPDCAMCYWAIAYAYGPNINAPMDSASAVAAFAAVRQAQELAPNASERERAYIEALATRYAAEPPADRAALDAAYAAAMGEVADRYPDDLDAATLHAEALMNLRPWAYWTLNGEPEPGTSQILSRLERVIERAPAHPGACHFYIHAVEAAEPEKAVPCAERLADAMPGAGHLVHMPAHIYIRVGRWDDAIEANQHATHADETFVADQRPSGVYPALYYPHNYHFLAFAGIMSGRSQLAIESARAAAQRVPPEVVRGDFLGEPLLAYPQLALAAFGRWDDVLDEPPPAADLRIATALTHYARGLALSAEQRWDDAGAALDSVTAIAAAHEEGPARTILDIARYSLAGDIAARRGDTAEGISQFREAMRLEDGLFYIEPPIWHLPVRHHLGAVLLDAGRANEAETLYREDLDRFPSNGWSLIGLAQSLEAQGDTRQAAEVRNRFSNAWANADVQLTSSRF